MNALANLYVAQHLQDLLDEVAKDRIRRTARSSRPSRIGSALSSLRAAVGRRPGGRRMSAGRMARWNVG
jgi:hypothetical protein